MSNMLLTGLGGLVENVIALFRAAGGGVSMSSMLRKGSLGPRALGIPLLFLTVVVAGSSASSMAFTWVVKGLEPCLLPELAELMGFLCWATAPELIELTICLGGSTVGALSSAVRTSLRSSSSACSKD